MVHVFVVRSPAFGDGQEMPHQAVRRAVPAIWDT